MLNQTFINGADDAPNVTVDDINNDFDVNFAAQPVKVLSHDEILDDLLSKITKADFAKIFEDNGISQSQQKHFVVAVVDELFEAASRNNYGLFAQNGFVYLYNGEFWKPIDKDEFRIFLAQVAARLGINNFESKHYDFRDKLFKQFFGVANAPKIKQSDSVLINLQNGTLEIIEDKLNLKDFDRNDFIKYQLPFEFDNDARCPMFNKFLSSVLPEKELQNVLAEFFGYCFVRHLKLEKCLFLYGTGANGKSVVFDIICAIFGEENICNFSLANLSEEHNRAFLANKLLNYSSELGTKKIVDSEIFKNLVSNEPVQARLKYGNSFTLERGRYAKLMFNCNELPRDIEHTNAFFRRFLIVPFAVTIPENKQDKELAQKIIKTELAGVFLWILRGLERLLKNKNFSQSKIIDEAVNDFRESSDSVKTFLDENGYTKVCQTADATPLKTIYADYKAFCSDYGFRAIHLRNLSNRLKASGYDCPKTGSGIIVYAKRPN